ncbi:MAG: cell division protein FtsZ [Betaproteobacteria bacterium]|nr:cell division protein FtsZ [Betaproteobacteria bacterium]
MSDLQFILIVVGICIIAAVLMFNWWQERRFHQQIAQGFSRLNNDALMDEPSLDVSKLDEPVDVFSDQLDFKRLDHAADDADDAQQQVRSLSQPHVEVHPQPAVDSPVVDSMDEFDQLSQNTHEEVTIDTVPSEASHKATEHQYDIMHESVVQHEALATQHEEIKAIFNEVFNHANESARQDVGAQVDKDPPNLEEALSEPELALPEIVHAQMDLSVILYLAKDMMVRELKIAISSRFEGYDKPVFVHLLDANKQWVLLQELADKLQHGNALVSRIVCSIQLADRGGAIQREMLNRFQQSVIALGVEIGAQVEWQSSGDAMEAANDLDAFCADVDKSMGFHLVHGESGAFTGIKLRGLVEAHGMVLDADGSFKYYDEASLNQSTGPKLASFIIKNRDQYPFTPEMLRMSVVKAVSFQLDIPHVKHCAESFNQMVQVARQMEVGLRAVLVDDNNRPLNDIQIEKIRQQLKIIHAKLLARGIMPGSESALRLFS